MNRRGVCAMVMAGNIEKRDTFSHPQTLRYMADHAGDRRSVVNPGTKLPARRRKSVLAPEERFWRPFSFCKTKQK